MFSRHGVRPKTVVAADHEHTLRELVASEIGLTLLREDMALNAQAAGEVAIWQPGVELSHLYFVFARDKEHTPALQAVVRAIRDVWKIGET
jgi:DNA-binding transcriptional LysR family regulator